MQNRSQIICFTLLALQSCSTDAGPETQARMNRPDLDSRRSDARISLVQNESTDLIDSVDISSGEGIAAVPAASSQDSGGSVGLDIYSWDATGDRRILELTTQKKRGMIGEVYNTPKHLFFTIHDNFRSQIRRGKDTCSVIILTKLTGVLTCLGNLRISSRITEWAKKPVIQTNSGGDHLVFSGFGGNGGGYEDLYYLNMSSGNSQLKNLTNDTDAYEEDYAINDDGDVVFKSSGRNARSFKFAKADGSAVLVGAANTAQWGRCLINGVGSYNNSFYAVRGTGSGGEQELIRMSKDNSGNFQPTTILTPNNDVNGFYCSYVIRTNDRLVFFGTKDSQGFLFTYEDRPEGQTDVWHTQLVRDIAEVNGATYDAENLFIHGEDALGSSTILKYHTATSSFATLVPHLRWVVNDMKGPSGGNLLVVAEQMSDSAFITSRVSILDGSTDVVSLKLPAVRQLIPLN